MGMMPTLEIFWGLDEITHIKHLDLAQLHEAHSVKNRENSADSCGRAVSPQPGPAAAPADREVRVRFPGEGWGRRAGVHWARQRLFIPGQMAQLHHCTPCESALTGKDCHGEGFLFRPRGVWSVGICSYGVWGQGVAKPRKSPRPRKHPMGMTPTYLIPVKLTLHERRWWFRIHFRGGKA